MGIPKVELPLLSLVKQISGASALSPISERSGADSAARQRCTRVRSPAARSCQARVHAHFDRYVTDVAARVKAEGAADAGADPKTAMETKR